jgi:hypothetical protein
MVGRMDNDPQLARLGRMVQAMRIEKGWLTREQFAEQVSFTSRVLQDLENGRRRLGKASYLEIEITLGWEPGSVSAILAGGDPTIRQESLSSAIASEEGHLDPSVLAVYRQVGRPELERRVHRLLVGLHPGQIGEILAAIEHDSLEDIYTQASAIDPTIAAN